MKYLLSIFFMILIGCGGGGGGAIAPELPGDTSALSALSDTHADFNTSSTEVAPIADTPQNDDSTSKTTITPDTNQTVSDPVPASLTCEATCIVKHPRSLTGRVVSVVDGDTIGVLVKKDATYTTYKVRLLYIDAPEKGQDFSKRAKEVLADMVAGKTVNVLYEDIDRYGRILGEVYVDDQLINKEMVRQGLAWVYRKYCYDTYYLHLEADARDEFSGLWSQPNPIPPWEYRKDSLAAKQADFTYLYSVEIPECSKPTMEEPKPDSPQKEDEAHYTCGVKRYCKQMDSCDEAYFYFAHCGLDRLDGDHDGVPCEALCR